MLQTGVHGSPLVSASKSALVQEGFFIPIITTVAASPKRAVRHLTQASSVKGPGGLGIELSEGSRPC